MQKNIKIIIMIRACLLFFLFFGCGRLLAQDADRQQLVDTSTDDYLRVIGIQSVLYYGNLQDGHPRTTNHPYLKEIQFVNARLSYFRNIYPEVLLRFDLSRNELIIRMPNFLNVVLFPENVDFAELHGYKIVYLPRDSFPGCPSPGYYYQLHSGKCKVLEKQTATLLLENITQQYYYGILTKFYLFHDGAYYNIRNKRSLLKVLQSHKKELKRFISAHNLKYRDDAESLITQTVIEYENLSGIQ